MSWRRLAEALLLAAVAAASLWLVWFVQQPSLAPGTDTSSGQQAYVLDGTVVQTDARGEVIYELRAERMDQLGDDREALLTDVRLDYHGDREGEDQRWTMQARQGRIMEDGQRVELDRDVVVEAPFTEGGDTRIYTDHLTVLTEPREATTTAAVRLEHRSGQVTAVGMHMWLNEERIRLESDVRGRYIP